VRRAATVQGVEVIMSLFAQIIRTVVNVVTLPVAVAKDVVMAPLDVILATNKHVGERTADHLQKLKDEAEA